MTKNVDNFNPKDEIRLLKEGLEPHNLSKKICEAIENQKDIDKSIVGIINTALKNSLETRNLVKEVTKEAIQEAQWNYWAKMTGLIIAVAVAFISGGYFKLTSFNN